MKTLIIEHTAPFQGLPELVADAEGLFAREGLQIAWVNTNEGANHDAATVNNNIRPRGVVRLTRVTQPKQFHTSPSIASRATSASSQRLSLLPTPLHVPPVTAHSRNTLLLPRSVSTGDIDGTAR